MAPIPKDQEAFKNCIKELVKSLPETKKAISTHTGVPVSSINALLSSKAEISTSELQRLFAYFNCTYELQENYLGDEFHDFRLDGGYTVFPVGKKRIVDLYGSISHGGDLVFAYELVHEGGYAPNHTRYLLVHTCFGIYTLMIIKDQGALVDELIARRALINFGGRRVACQELFHELDQHEYLISCEPHNRRAFDLTFFADKRLAFAQLEPSLVTEP